MTIDRAIEILNPEHRENYDGLDEVNEACRMGMEALERTRWIPCSERLPKDGQDVLCWYQYFRYGNYNRLWQTYGIGFQYNGNWGGEISALETLNGVTKDELQHAIQWLFEHYQFDV